MKERKQQRLHEVVWKKKTNENVTGPVPRVGSVPVIMKGDRKNIEPINSFFALT